MILTKLYSTIIGGNLFFSDTIAIKIRRDIISKSDLDLGILHHF